MGLSILKVTHMEVHFSLAKESLIIARVVLQTISIPLEGLVIVFLGMLYLTKDEVEGGLDILHFLSVGSEIAVLRLYFDLDNLQASLAELSSQLEFLLREIVFCKIDHAQWVSWIGLECFLEVSHSILSHIKVIDV